MKLEISRGFMGLDNSFMILAVPQVIFCVPYYSNFK